MAFRFSWRTTLTCGLLALLMLRASVWQWHRHKQKEALLATLREHLQAPIVTLGSVLETLKTDPVSLEHRRVRLKGTYDFQHEIILRNRRHGEMPGAHVITPLKLDGTNDNVMVSRGFIPYGYTEKDKRLQFQHPPNAEFVGLIKKSVSQRFLAPADPPSGPGHPWVDAWLRVDLENISKQLPYPVLPAYIEVMGEESSLQSEDKIISQRDGREELFYLGNKSVIPKPLTQDELSKFPIIDYDTIVPPSRHLGYVYEWGGMALVTVLMGLVLQLKRPRKEKDLKSVAEPDLLLAEKDI